MIVEVVASAVTAVASLASRVLARVWGDRTKQDDTLEQELTKEEAAFDQAIHAGDMQSATAVYERLVRLRDRARSRRLQQ